MPFARHAGGIAYHVCIVIAIVAILGVFLPEASSAAGSAAPHAGVAGRIAGGRPATPRLFVPSTYPDAAPAPAPLAASTTITATLRDALFVDADGDERADPGDVIRYTAEITNNLGQDARGVAFNVELDASTALTGTIQVSPLARADTYNTVGNVPITVTHPAGLLSNDFGMPPPGAVAGTYASAGGGVVSVRSDGGFTYDPPAGFRGTDTFTYTISSAAGSDTGTVTVSVSGMAWFINNNPGACAKDCDGRFTHPFPTLAAFQMVNNGEANHPAAKDIIFLYESETSYEGPVTLLNEQRLIGQDATSSFETLSGLAAPAGMNWPAMQSSNAVMARITATGTAITLARSNRLYGLTAGGSDTAIRGTTIDNLSVADIRVNSSGGALYLSDGTLIGAFTAITSTGGVNNIYLANLSDTNPTSTISLGTGALSGASSHAFVVSGGNANFSYAGSITSSTARPVTVANRTGGTLTLTGAVSSSAQGISLTDNNTSTTVNFNGGVTLNTGAQAAFTATYGGRLSVIGSSNTITTTTGTALAISNTTIVAAGLTFKSISANGGSNGIVLNNTGTAGGLVVTGTGAAGSGGTIQNTEGGDGESAGIGVYLANTRNVSLRSMVIKNNQNFGIYGDSVTGLQIEKTEVSGQNGTNPGYDEASAAFKGLYGSVRITGTTFTGGVESNVWVANSSGNLDLDITGCTFRNNHATTGDDGLLIEGSGTASIDLTVSDSIFTAHGGEHFQFNGAGSGAFTLVFQNNTLTGGHPDSLGQGIIVSTGDHSGTLTYTIERNSINGNVIGGAINVIKGTGSGTFTGSVLNNTVGSADAANSGSAQASGIRIEAHGTGIHKAQVADNKVYQYNNHGIELDAGDGSAGLQVTVENNTVASPGAAARHGIYLNAGSITTDANLVCAHITNNTAAGSGANGYEDIFVSQRMASTVRLPGYGGGNRNTVDVANFLKNQNGANSTNAQVAASSGGGFIGGAACELPAAFAPAHLVQLIEDEGSHDVRAEQANAFEPLVHGGSVRSLLAAVAGRPVSAAATLPSAGALGHRPALFAFAPATVTANIGTLPVGKRVRITFEVVVNDSPAADAMYVSNQGSVSGDNFTSFVTDDPDTPQSKDATVTPLQTVAALSLHASVSPSSAEPGDIVTYTLAITNQGYSLARGVILTGTIPAGVTVDSVVAAGLVITQTGAAPDYVWALQDLAAGQAGTLSLYGTLDLGQKAGEILTHQAGIHSAVDDPNSGDNWAAASLTVENSVPLATSDHYAVVEDTPLTVERPGVLENDSDANGDSLVAELVRSAQNGTLTLAADGAFAYEPDADYYGEDSFTYRAADGAGASSIVTATLDVAARNDPPRLDTIADQTIDEDAGPQTVALSGISSGAANEAQTLIITATSDNTGLISHPLISYTSPSVTGSLTYTPSENQHGSARLSVNVSDGISETTRVFTVTVNSVEDPPVAAGDSYATAEDTPLAVAAPGVLANDVAVEGGELTAILVEDVTSGQLQLQTDGSFVYTPTLNFSGPVTFTYGARSGALVDSARVRLDVTPVNDAPELAAIGDRDIDEGSELRFIVTATDVDGPGDTLYYSLEGAPSGASIGVLSGEFAWTPSEAQGPGVYTVTVRVEDDGTPALSDAETIRLRVAAVNDAPELEAIGDQSVVEGTELRFLVAATDQDIPADTLSYSLEGAPAGAGIDAGSGEFTWTPTEAQGPGTYTVTVRVEDNGSPVLADSESVRITVREVNAKPVTVDDYYTVDEGGTLDIAVPGVLLNDSDAEGNPLTASLAGDVAHGILTLESDGSFTYVHDGSEGLEDRFTYRAFDGALLSDETTVLLTITPVNDAPTAVADIASTPEDTPVAVAVLANDIDPDDDTLQVIALTQPAHGVAVNDAEGRIHYEPDENYHGPDQLIYTISDSMGATASAQLDLVVTPVNDAPVAIGDSASLDEDTLIDIQVLANDVDIEGDTLFLAAVANPSHGVAAADANGNIRYTPAADYNGADCFSYTVSDGNGGTASAFVDVTVHAINDAPVISSPGDRVNRIGDTVSLMLSASDVDGDTLGYAATGLPPGLVVDQQTGLIQGRIAADAAGVYNVRAETSDGQLSAGVTFRWTISQGEQFSHIQWLPQAWNSPMPIREDTGAEVGDSRRVPRSDPDELSPR